MIILKILFWPFYLSFWLFKVVGQAMFVNDVIDHFHEH